MTIIAGFKSAEGIIICGDTQETVSGLSKRHVSKVRVEPTLSEEARKLLGGSDLRMAFGGAGDGPFIDLMINKAWKSAQHTSSLNEAAEAIDGTIKATYQEYGQIYQAGQCPSVELIYGLKLEDDSALFHATGPIINEVAEFCSTGTGYYMADYLASKMYNSTLTLYQCVTLAAYILHQAIEHVDGCGGESHIAVLRHHGRSGLIDQSRIRAVTDLIKSVDQELGHVLISAANYWTDSKDFKQELIYTEQVISSARDATMRTIEQADSTSKELFTWLGGSGERDPLGFLITSSGQHSESEP